MFQNLPFKFDLKMIYQCDKYAKKTKKRLREHIKYKHSLQINAIIAYDTKS